MEHNFNCNQIDINLERIPSANYCPLKKCRVGKNLRLNISEVKLDKPINTFTLSIGANQRARLM